MPVFDRLTSIHGRRIAMSATGAIVDKEGYGALMVDASGVVQGIMKSAVELISSSAAVLVGVGMSYLSSASASSRNFSISIPSSGQKKEIYSLSSASVMLLETTSSDVKFTSTAGLSTALTFGGVTGYGSSITLRGLSATRWAVINKSTTWV